MASQYGSRLICCNQKRIGALARLIREMPNGSFGLNFYSFRGKEGEEIVADKMYPPLNHPGAIGFFFYVCSQQFGFWYGNHKGYVGPLFGTLDGKEIKGSDLLWQLAMRALKAQEDFFSPANLAQLTPAQFAKFLSDDNGPIPFPDWETRYCLTTAYGQCWPYRQDDSPVELVDWINASPRYRLQRFLDWISGIPGFSGDPLDKKPLLLAMALANRPEHFLKVTVDSPEWMPIVDYHLMRLALRLGLVEVNGHIAEILSNRKWCDSETEEKVRAKVYDAISKVILLSGKPMAFIDHIMWSARKYCPEMSEPQCDSCKLNSVCAKRTKLFQSILRTTNY